MVAATVRHNVAINDTVSLGGGVMVFGGGTIQRSTIYDNAVAFGVAGARDVVASVGGRLRIANSTIGGELSGFSDTCFQDLCFPGTDVVLENVTVDELSFPWSFDGGSFTARNSVIGDCQTWIVSAGFNLINSPATSCSVVGDETGVLLGVDPLLGPLADNGGPTLTRLPLAGSPLLGSGSPSPPGDEGACLRRDQRGTTRPLGAGCDLGAVEVE